jgi:hypothetical protein
MAEIIKEVTLELENESSKETKGKGKEKVEKEKENKTLFDISKKLKPMKFLEKPEY